MQKLVEILDKPDLFLNRDSTRVFSKKYIIEKIQFIVENQVVDKKNLVEIIDFVYF